MTIIKNDEKTANYEIAKCQRETNGQKKRKWVTEYLTA